jgi:hypothetical protein
MNCFNVILLFQTIFFLKKNLRLMKNSRKNQRKNQRMILKKIPKSKNLLIRNLMIRCCMMRKTCYSLKNRTLMKNWRICRRCFWKVLNSFLNLWSNLMEHYNLREKDLSERNYYLRSCFLYYYKNSKVFLPWSCYRFWCYL